MFSATVPVGGSDGPHIAGDTLICANKQQNIASKVCTLFCLAYFAAKHRDSALYETK